MQLGTYHRSGQHPDRKRTGIARGSSMMEVLVSILILSFGMLGVGGLQVTALRNAQNSYNRSVATFLADDLMDRMRANRSVALTTSSDYTNYSGTTAANTCAVGDSVSTCDMKTWKQAVTDQLPSATVTIVIASSIVTITIKWGERESADAEFKTESRL